MLRPVIHDRAFADLNGICAYLGETSRRAATRFLTATLNAIEKLPEFPGRGSLRDFGNDALVGMRTIDVPGFEGYGIYYVTTQTTIEILRVIHGSRDLEQIFGETGEESAGD